MPPRVFPQLAGTALVTVVLMAPKLASLMERRLLAGLVRVADNISVGGALGARDSSSV